MDEAVLLKQITVRRRGIRELIAAVGWKPLRVLDMLKKLEEDGLVKFESAPSGSRGRPKKIVSLTPLGRRFLDAFQECERLRLRTNPNDVRRAVLQTKDTERLIAAGRSPYQMLWELDEIVRAVRNSAKAT